MQASERCLQGLVVVGEGRALFGHRPLGIPLLQTQSIEVAVARLAIAVFAQDDLDPDADVRAAAGDHPRRWRGGDDGRGVVTATARIAGIGRAVNVTDMGLHLDLDHLAVLIQRRVGLIR